MVRPPPGLSTGQRHWNQPLLRRLRIDLRLPHSYGMKQAAPQKAYDLLAQLRARYGKPLPGYVGGREFQNRERRLPPGHYREYDMNPKIRGRSRDTERIVIEQDTGRAYYTGNHYRTFMPLHETP